MTAPGSKLSGINNWAIGSVLSLMLLFYIVYRAGDSWDVLRLLSAILLFVGGGLLAILAVANTTMFLRTKEPDAFFYGFVDVFLLSIVVYLYWYPVFVVK